MKDRKDTPNLSPKFAKLVSVPSDDARLHKTEVLKELELDLYDLANIVARIKAGTYEFGNDNSSKFIENLSENIKVIDLLASDKKDNKTAEVITLFQTYYKVNYLNEIAKKNAQLPNEIEIPTSRDIKNSLFFIKFKMSDLNKSIKFKLNELLSILKQNKKDPDKEIENFMDSINSLKLDDYRNWFEKVKSNITKRTSNSDLDNQINKALLTCLYEINDHFLTKQDSKDIFWLDQSGTLNQILDQKITQNLLKTEETSPIINSVENPNAWHERVESINKSLINLTSESKPNKTTAQDIKDYKKDLLTISNWHDVKTDNNAKQVKEAALSAEFNSQVVVDFKSYYSEKNKQLESIPSKIYKKTIGSFLLYENSNNPETTAGRKKIAEITIRKIESVKTYKDYIELLKHFNTQILILEKLEKPSRLKDILIEKRQFILNFINNNCPTDIKKDAYNVVNKNLMERFSNRLKLYRDEKYQSLTYRIRKTLFNRTIKTDNKQMIVDNLLNLIKEKNNHEFTIDVFIEYLTKINNALKDKSLNKDSILYGIIFSMANVFAKQNSRNIAFTENITNNQIELLNNVIDNLADEIKPLFKNYKRQISVNETTSNNKKSSKENISKFEIEDEKAKSNLKEILQKRIQDEKLKQQKLDYFENTIKNDLCSELLGAKIIKSRNIQKTKIEPLYNVATLIGMGAPLLTAVGIPYSTTIVKGLVAAVTTKADMDSALHQKNMYAFASELELADVEPFAKALAKGLTNAYQQQIALVKFSEHDKSDLNSFIKTMLDSIIYYLQNNKITHKKFENFNQLVNEIIVEAIIFSRANLARSKIMLEGEQGKSHDVRTILQNPPVLILDSNNLPELDPKDPEKPHIIVNEESTYDYGLISLQLTKEQQDSLGRAETPRIGRVIADKTGDRNGHKRAKSIGANFFIQQAEKKEAEDAALKHAEAYTGILAQFKAKDNLVSSNEPAIKKTASAAVDEAIQMPSSAVIETNSVATTSTENSSSTAEALTRASNIFTSLEKAQIMKNTDELKSKNSSEADAALQAPAAAPICMQAD